MIQHALIQATRADDRGVRHRGFHVIRKNVAPVAVLVEGGFLSNPEECRQVAHPGYRDLQAWAIASAIAQFMGHYQTEPPQRPSLLVSHGHRPDTQGGSHRAKQRILPRPVRTHHPVVATVTKPAAFTKRLAQKMVKVWR